MVVNDKIIDIAGLSRYNENLKNVLNKQEQDVKDYAYRLVNSEDGVSLFDAAGAADQALVDAKSYADEVETAAITSANTYADGLNTAMDERVMKLEEIDHEQLVAGAIAAVVAGAESDFDTLKEVADWINNDTTGAAALQVTVAEHTKDIESLSNGKQDNIADLETIRSGAAAGAVAEQNANAYTDGVGAQVLADAKADAANLYQVKGEYLIASDFGFATNDDIDALFV